MDVAIDQAREDCEAGPINHLRIAGNLDARAPSGVRYVPVLDQDDCLADGVTSSRVEERVSVERPNHRPILMRSATETSRDKYMKHRMYNLA
jgi:hypothetical protein